MYGRRSNWIVEIRVLLEAIRRAKDELPADVLAELLEDQARFAMKRISGDSDHLGAETVLRTLER